MKIAIGIIAVLLIVSIVYFFLPQGIKTTVNAIFTGNNSAQQNKAQASPAASASPQASVAPSATPFRIGTPNPTVVGSIRPTGSARASATPRATTRAATVSGSTNKLPGTGFDKQPAELIVMQVLACTLLLLVGIRLSKHA